jgi:hypothetical protein
VNQRVPYWASPEDLERAKRDYVIPTVEEYNSLATAIQNDKEWFDKFMELVHHYYEQEPCGGQLHIVLDDGNLEDTHISWCAGLANGVQDHEASDLANLMEFMSMEQRQRVYENVY